MHNYFELFWLIKWIRSFLFHKLSIILKSIQLCACPNVYFVHKTNWDNSPQDLHTKDDFVFWLAGNLILRFCVLSPMREPSQRAFNLEVSVLNWEKIPLKLEIQIRNWNCKELKLYCTIKYVLQGYVKKLKLVLLGNLQLLVLQSLLSSLVDV